MVGRPHPMINSSQRALRIVQEARDPNIGILLLDFILGFNSSMDPVGELIDFHPGSSENCPIQG